jgi:polyisoprenoid-binding protein YceI
MTPIRRLSVFSTLMILLVTTLSFNLKGDLLKWGYHSQNLNISVEGTSTLHDWHIKSDKGQCEATFVLANDKLTGLSGLNFAVPAESLKSGNSMMDNNTYKALKTGSFKTVNFVLSSATVSPVDASTYQIKAIGKLTIAGTTKETDLVATAKLNAADKSFTVSGTKKLKMTDYNVKPPTVMMGTIKTGNDITISFNAKIVK